MTAEAKLKPPHSDTCAAQAMRPRSCGDCVFYLWDGGLWLRTLASGFPVAGMCANHPATPGQLREIPQDGPCRNFRPTPRPQAVEPPPPPDETVRYIPLTRGLHAIVDAKHYEALSRYKWSVHDTGEGKAQYAVRGSKGRKIFMHREIMKTPPGMVVDHIQSQRPGQPRSQPSQLHPPPEPPEPLLARRPIAIPRRLPPGR